MDSAGVVRQCGPRPAGFQSEPPLRVLRYSLMVPCLWSRVRQRRASLILPCDKPLRMITGRGQTEARGRRGGRGRCVIFC